MDGSNPSPRGPAGPRNRPACRRRWTPCASGQQPEIRKLADVIERLGKLSGGVAVPAAPTREPVPDWLAQRLIYTVGMAPQDVAALSLEEAVNRWGEFMSKPR